MLHVDIPSRSDIQRLSAVRTSSCLSIYLPTTPITQDAQADRIALKNLARQGLEQLTQIGIPKRERDTIDEALGDLIDDDRVLALPGQHIGGAGHTRRNADLPPAEQAGAGRGGRRPLLHQAAAARADRVAVGLCAGAGTRLGAPGRGVGRPACRSRQGAGPAQRRGQCRRQGVDPGPHGQRAHPRQRRPEGAAAPVRAAGRPRAARPPRRQRDAVDPGRAPAAGRDLPFGVQLPASGRRDSGMPPEESSDADLAQASRAVLDRLHATELASLRDQFAARSAQGAPPPTWRRPPRLPPSARCRRCSSTSTTSCPGTSTTTARCISMTPMRATTASSTRSPAARWPAVRACSVCAAPMSPAAAAWPPSCVTSSSRGVRAVRRRDPSFQVRGTCPFTNFLYERLT